jgi:hypothetical protein
VLARILNRKIARKPGRNTPAAPAGPPPVPSIPAPSPSQPAAPGPAQPQLERPAPAPLTPSSPAPSEPALEINAHPDLPENDGDPSSGALETTGLSIQQLAKEEAATRNESGSHDPDSLGKFGSGASGTFTGSLCGFNISELIQFLNSTRESGTLAVTNDADHTRCEVFFENGEIVHATSGEAAGEPAVGAILALHDGFFVFKRQEYLPVERTVTAGTMSLLMAPPEDVDPAPVAEPEEVPEPEARPPEDDPFELSADDAPVFTAGP